MQTRLVVCRCFAVAIIMIALAAPAFSQSAADNSSKDSSKHDDVSTLRQQIAEQQKEIEQLRAVVDQMKQRLDQTPAPATAKAAPAPAPAPAVTAPVPMQTVAAATTSLGEVASTTPILPKAVKSAASGDATIIGSSPVPTAAVHTAAQEASASDQVSPLQFHIGSATFTPVGFLDFTGVFHNHAAGGSIGTSFGSIPYGTTAYTTNLSEIRLSMQNSRIGFRTDADIKGAHVIGYMEADFLGNNATNTAVTSNSNTLRSRLYWVDIMKGNWELLGGQTWSLLTPGRRGISPLPADIFYTQDMDVNYQAGLFWGRIPELRLVYHASDKVAAAIAIDSPDQYAGGSSGGPTVTFPSAIASTYGCAPTATGAAVTSCELDASQSSGGLGAPNVAPDVIAKIALDPNNRVHFEFGGIERNFKVWYPGVAAVAATATTPAVAAVPSATYTAVGGGGFLNLGVEIFKGFRLLTNNFYSDGGGRYIFGQVPDVIAHADGSISLIHASSTVTGFEYTNKNTLIFAYYGGIYAGRNTAVDTTGKLVGYGVSSSQNKSIQEETIGFNQAIWKNPRYGAVNIIGQYSYLQRFPWVVASGAPTNANLNEVFFDLRYTLPGSAPTLGKFAR